MGMNIKDRKALSPVVSVILMVIIAIGASALAYTWYVGVQKGVTGESGTTAAKMTLASSAAIVITNLEYNSSGINVTVANIGSVNVTGLRMYIDNVYQPSAGDTYVDVDGIAALWNSTDLSLSSGVHRVKISSPSTNAEASQIFVT